MNVKGSITEHNPVIVKTGECNRSSIYAAADEVIKASIISNLNWYSHTPVEEVKVTVKSGYVELYGHVQWMYQKMVIAAMVQKIEGVMGIINNIHVRLQYTDIH